VVWGDGTPLREYTYARDVARAFMWCLEHYSGAQVLNTGTTEELTVKEIAFLIADSMGIDRNRIRFDTSKPNGVMRKGTDNSRFLALSGFSYTPFAEGLRMTIEWFVNTYESCPETVRLYSKSKG
jgi:GDP-L-fucose synthase